MRKRIVISDDLVITKDNVKTIGEKIAVSATQKAKRFAYGSLDELYKGLVADINYTPETYSDGYDIAQEAICFLCNYIGQPVGKVCVKDIHGKYECIRLATFKVVYTYLRKQKKCILDEQELDNTLIKTIPQEEPINEDDYIQVDNTISKLNLTEREQLVLQYMMNQVLIKNIAEFLHIDRKSVYRARLSIKEKYLAYMQ